ncbi:VanZ family protein [Blastococcus haudaquaticus]|uniref:VanZ like family protein n=1 Tax=Blastococcus haudaquaticus TaxID=1938745 RepID=A0A286GY66_9ACTN|nr:VanZ family protein [Blastococcus haudaquaticus]SOE00431.1 VanZ like family protein [Blastococcus haudaquaticus]
MTPRWALRALVLFAVLVGASTLGPSPAELIQLVTETARTDAGISSVSFERVELVANVLLFVPIGLLLAAALPRTPAWQVWALCSGASLLVEVVQTVLPDRQPTVTDVLANSAGAAVGVLLLRAVRRRRAQRPGGPAPCSPHE